MKNSRIVITGLGVISSIGIGKDEFWKNLIAGKSGISEVQFFDTSNMDRHFAGEVHDFRPEDFIEPGKAKKMGRAPQLAVAAAKLALEDSRIHLDSKKTGIAIGTTMGQSREVEIINKAWVEDGEDKVNTDLIPILPGNVISSYVSREFGIAGENTMIPTACASGNYAIGHAFDLLRMGKVDIMLAGGVDAFSKVAFTGFARLFAMSKGVCRPFDKTRDGMLVGEGAAMLVLERLEDVEERGAKIYAEVLGYGLSCDAHHVTQPHVDGVKSCMIKAMKEAGINREDVNYICAHGTGTPANDKVESMAIHEVFNSRAKQIPVSSIKSMLGHTMGTASAIEAIACCLALKNGIIPPTINYETPDPDCDIDCVPNVARKADLNVVLNNSYAFGGNNACLMLRKFEND